MVKCCAPLCGNSPYRKTPAITFHRFPKDENLKNAWLMQMNKKNWQHKTSSVLCSEHFEAHLVDCSGFRTVLTSNAIPMIFDSSLQHMSTSSVKGPVERKVAGDQVLMDLQNLQPSNTINKEEKMAVKKHKLVADDHNQLDLATLAKYLQVMNEQLGLPPPQELITHCQDIIKCLARTAGTVDQLWELLQPIEYFLLRIVTAVHSNVRHDIFTAILDKLQTLIADPQSEACPATAVVLIILDESDEEAALSYARWLVQRTENGLEGAGLPAALSRLYQWLQEWPSSSALGFWLQCYIKALEEKEYYDLLTEISLNNLAGLFSCLTKPQPIYLNTANVIFHVLASLRDSVEAFDSISSMVEAVLVNLASDSSQWSRQLLQDVVDILSAMVDCISSNFKGDAQDRFRDKYSSVILCLERHMASRACKFLKVSAWRKRNNADGGNNNTTKPGVGLMNLGNTCYMNSVVQALLVIRQFSSHVLRRAMTVPYWEKMGELFAHMMFSVAVTVNPDTFFRILRPPFFTLNNQQDSSEFLGYLFELLQSYEHSRETNHDYSRPPVLRGANRFRVMNAHVPQTSQPQSSSDDEQSEPDENERSLSPRPSSSNGSGSSGWKRSATDGDGNLVVQRKRSRKSEASFVLRSDSAIDGMFAGVLLTRVQCTSCQTSFLSRDVFRDLQLAFPEKPEGWQHSVQSLLEYYCSKESLTGDNRYACNGCGDLCDAERSVLIETTPKYLILVLKNFKFDSKVQVQTKLMHSVYYNHQVKLPTVRAQAQHATFNLFAAVIHGGTTLDTGHYYTLAKDGDQWFEYDDSLVTCTDESRINKLSKACTPYILFYRRTDIEEPTAPCFEELPRWLRDKISAENKLHSGRLRKRVGRP